PPQDKLMVAEQALSAVLRFHEAARASGQRVGEAWDGPRDALRKKLLDVLIQRVELLAGGRERDQKPDWEQAIDLARSASAVFPGDEDKARLARPVVQLVEQALKSGRTGDESFREGLRWLRTLEEAFPRSPAIKPISDRLAAQAKSLMTQAQDLVDKKKLKE